MKYEIKTVGKDAIQLTTYDERWYLKTDEKTKTTLFVPSVTWIVSYYPKGIGFMKWLASKGWDEAESIKTDAGEKGSKIHQAVEMLLNGEEIKHSHKFMKFGNYGEALEEELTGEEYEAIYSFQKWYELFEPKIIKTEFPVFTEKYAGTVDFICEIKGEKYLIDLKTSQFVWPSHELQVSAYNHALGGKYKTAILQIGYAKNKAGYKFTEIADKYDLFEATYQIWENEVSKKQPLQKDLPLSLSLKIKKK